MKKPHHSGLLLIAAGLLGATFFVVTDPRIGRQRLAADAIDRVNEARIGTSVGVVGSSAVLLIGAWLMTRRTI